MEHDLPDSSPGEHEIGYQIDPIFDSRAEAWGFIEPDDAIELKRRAVEDIIAGDFSAALAYRLEAEKSLDHLHGSEMERAELGMLVTIATFYRDAGLLEDYLDHLHDAWTYANHGMQNIHADIVAAIEAEATQYLNDNL